MVMRTTIRKSVNRMPCGLSEAEFRKRFPPFLEDKKRIERGIRLKKQCACGKLISFDFTPAFCWSCGSFTHPVYVRTIEFYYSDQKVRDVHKGHAPVNLLIGWVAKI
jgi:hypothetical protein